HHATQTEASVDAFRRDAPITASMPIISDTPELVLLSNGARAKRFTRDDVVLRKGEYTLINGHLTPRESMITDLLSLRGILERNSIPYLLVRGSGDTLVLA